MALGSTRIAPEEAMLDVLRAATLLAAVLAGVWLYNSMQTGSVFQLTGVAQ
jgi:site-specific recombinase